MSGWSGFTDRELERLKSENEMSVQTGTKTSNIGKTQRKKVREKKLQNAPKPAKENAEVVKKEDPSNEIQSSKSVGEVNVEECDGNTKKVLDVIELSDEKVAELEMSSLEQLQIKQKLIEDQNKKKQELIKQALHQKFKQTQNESVKLKDIQKQLNHLDQTLQTDVEVLRNKIDESCLLFSQAQKRYEKAESEYVAAKLDFFEKKEQKESLTEHLYSIIQANEIRKAKKLEELMIKLSDPSSPVLEKMPDTVNSTSLNHPASVKVENSRNSVAESASSGDLH